MNLFDMALAQSRANPSVAHAQDESDACTKRYDQLVDRYNQLVKDCKNLQETCRYESQKNIKLREILERYAVNNNDAARVLEETK